MFWGTSVMKRTSLLFLAGVLGTGFLITGFSQPAEAFGSWSSREGACSQPHEPRVRHRTVRRHVVERPGIYVIKRKPGLYGWRKVKVRTPSGRVVWRKKRVLLRPYKNIAEYHKPKQRWVRERQRIVEAPPRPRGAWPDGC